MNRLVGKPVAVVWGFLACACSAGVDQLASESEAASGSDDVGQSPLERAWDPSVSEVAFQRAVAEPLHLEQTQAIAAEFERAGIAISEDQFVGHLLRLDDGYLEVEPLLERLEARGVLDPAARGDGLAESNNVDKGQVLAQTFDGFAPNAYADQDNTTFFFSRPEIPTATNFEHWIVLDNAAPAFLATEFTQAIADIAAAANDDCLEPGFMTVHRQREVDALDPIVAPLKRLHRVVFDVVGVACPGFPATFQGGCSNFLQVRAVTLVPTVPAPGGGGGVFQRRMIFGDRIGITNGVSAGSVDLLTHELLHSLGIAHPREEVFPGSLVVAAKFNVPGTVNTVAGFPSIMHNPFLVDRFNNPILDAARKQIPNPDYSDTLSGDDIDVIRTLYHEGNAPLDCQFSTDDTIVAPR